METDHTTHPRMADYVRPLIARAWLILAAVVVATGGVYAFYARKHNVYEASTLVFVRDPGDPVTGVPTPQSTDRNVQNQASLLYSRDTAAAVASKIGYRGTAEALLKQVSISSKPGEDFVEVGTKDGAAQGAATIANAFARQLVSSLNDAYKSRIAAAIQISKTQLAQRQTSASSQIQRADLLDQLNRLQLALRVPTAVARRVDPALAPDHASAPKPLRNALFAFILSLVGAVAVAFGLERFDRRLKNPDEMENVYGSPLLAVLPRAGDPAPTEGGEPALGPDFREPFRVLRTNIELASVDARPRTIVISSAMPGEGKSTVVRNLALALGESGSRVAVVDLDLRRPSMARLFGVRTGRGITDVLRHDAELDEVTLRIGLGLPALDELVRADVAGVAARNGNQRHNGAVQHGPEIALLRSGALPSNPPAVLASGRVVEVLDSLAARYDVVLIDSAPLLSVTDTVPLLRYADATLLVGRLDVTTRDTAKRLMEFVARVPGVNLLGVVANDLSRLEAGAFGYGYEYESRGDESKRGRGRLKAAVERPKQPV